MAPRKAGSGQMGSPPDRLLGVAPSSIGQNPTHDVADHRIPQGYLRQTPRVPKKSANKSQTKKSCLIGNPFIISGRRGRARTFNPRLRRPVRAISPECHALPYRTPITRVKAHFGASCLPCFTPHLQAGSPQNPPQFSPAYLYVEFYGECSQRAWMLTVANSRTDAATNWG